jgi:predicted Fe-Mo cluster-binding NifX family protein
MIAIPVKTNKQNTAVSPLFGKAKYFALVQNGDIQIVKNEANGGRAVVSWLKSLGVTKLITSHMGQNPFNILQSSNIKVYFAGDERIELTDVLVKYADGDLVLLNSENYDKYIKEDDHHHEHSHSHAHGNGHGHGQGTCCGQRHPKVVNLLKNRIQDKIAKNFQFKG